MPTNERVTRERDMLEDELKPCPSCTEADVKLHSEFDYVQCHRCGVRGPIFNGHPKDARAGWNKLPRKDFADSEWRTTREVVRVTMQKSIYRVNNHGKYNSWIADYALCPAQELLGFKLKQGEHRTVDVEIKVRVREVCEHDEQLTKGKGVYCCNCDELISGKPEPTSRGVEECTCGQDKKITCGVCNKSEPTDREVEETGPYIMRCSGCGVATGPIKWIDDPKCKKCAEPTDSDRGTKQGMPATMKKVEVPGPNPTTDRCSSVSQACADRLEEDIETLHQQRVFANNQISKLKVAIESVDMHNDKLKEEQDLLRFQVNGFNKLRETIRLQGDRADRLGGDMNEQGLAFCEANKKQNKEIDRLKAQIDGFQVDIHSLLASRNSHHTALLNLKAAMSEVAEWFSENDHPMGEALKKRGFGK